MVWAAQLVEVVLAMEGNLEIFQEGNLKDQGILYLIHILL